MVSPPMRSSASAREMKASALLKGNVTRITDADTAQELDGSLYMVMELRWRGPREAAAREKPLDPVSVIFILGIARSTKRTH